jgi:Mn-dependent DtxR family transcriptional regulator
MKIKASAEDYLESILILTRQLGRVRSVDLAAYMNFSKPSVSIIVKKFRESGYITIEDERYLTLTPKGEEIAKRIHQRHTLLIKILTSIGVSEKTAKEDACKIEHNISDETFNCIRNYYESQQ